MSHEATRWAMRQKGLKPAAKVVLWFLADCHNAKTGDCFPMQETIARECEMSRSTVNIHLDALEKAGLIRREASVHDETKRQRPTRYVLLFQAGPVSENHTRAASEIETRAVSDFQADPCPKNDESRVRNSDSNPVREPGIEPVRGAGERKSTEQPFEHPDRSAEQDRFPEFWAAYPLKQNRTKAEAEFIVAAITTPAEQIIAGAKAYASARADADPRYTTQPATWLKDKRWTDELPSTTGKPLTDRQKRFQRTAARYA